MWLLKKAVDWDVIDRMPCAVTLLPVPKASMSFYDFDEYERLVSAASTLDATAHHFCSHLAMRGAPPRAIQELADIENWA
jgi:hypothetical protein